MTRSNVGAFSRLFPKKVTTKEKRQRVALLVRAYRYTAFLEDDDSLPVRRVVSRALRSLYPVRVSTVALSKALFSLRGDSSFISIPEERLEFIREVTLAIPDWPSEEEVLSAVAHGRKQYRAARQLAA